MDYELTGEQKEFRKNFRAFCENEIAPRAGQVDSQSAFSFENLRRLAATGFLGMPFPEKYGGSQKPLLTCMIAWEELARACPSTFLSCGIGSSLAGILLNFFGTEDQKGQYLIGLTGGEKVGAFALSEPHCGSDMAALKTEARKEGRAYLLNGAKSFVTNGPIADFVILIALTDPGAPLDQKMSAFIIEKDMPGFTAGPPLEKLGARGSPLSQITLKNCLAPEENLLAKEGGGYLCAAKAKEFGRLGFAAYSLGVAQACLEESIKYAQSRMAFGRPIAHFQEVSFKIADMQMFVDTGRLLLYRAAWIMDQGLEASTDISIAKLFISEAATWCAVNAVQIHGGYGFLKEYKVERLYRDAKLGEIGEGTSEMQRIAIARSLLGEGF
ncbi:MAG: acyl-CoA dehydrogenase family protein [Thermodesulfobacteriota bacterium]|nr:acyl-CoA dehydrogenase family protein [Thermodesulfobacteriota bacterium]